MSTATPTPARKMHLKDLLLDKREVERGISQAQAGRECGVSRQAYSMWELGVYPPSKEHIPAVAAFLGLPQEDVMESVGLLDSDAAEVIRQARRRGRFSGDVIPGYRDSLVVAVR